MALDSISKCLNRDLLRHFYKLCLFLGAVLYDVKSPPKSIPNIFCCSLCIVYYVLYIVHYNFNFSYSLQPSEFYIYKTYINTGHCFNLVPSALLVVHGSSERRKELGYEVAKIFSILHQ